MGKLSPWLQLDSPHQSLRRRSEEAFKQEITWAAHLSITSLLLDAPPTDCANLARHVQWACLSAAHSQFLVRVPLNAPSESELIGDEVALHAATGGAGLIMSR